MCELFLVIDTNFTSGYDTPLKAKDQKHDRNKGYCVGLLNLARLDPGFLQL